jgi:uncharacterized protein (TIGR03089 family)
VSTERTTPAQLLRALVDADPGRPRITVYDDTDSPTRGERIELSARVLANWVAKAANLLRDELDVEVGSVVRLDLPPHWRTLYWALATWSVGGCVEVPLHRRPDAVASPAALAAPGSWGADVVVTDAVDVASAVSGASGTAVLVTLAALARSAGAPVPAGVVDEARELATHGDVFDAWDRPDPSDPALRVLGAAGHPGDDTASGGGSGDGDTAYGALVPERTGGPERVHTSTTDTAQFLRLALDTWAGDGSLVLTRGVPTEQALASRLTAEGVTRTA